MSIPPIPADVTESRVREIVTECLAQVDPERQRVLRDSLQQLEVAVPPMLEALERLKAIDPSQLEQALSPDGVRQIAREVMLDMLAQGQITIALSLKPRP